MAARKEAHHNPKLDSDVQANRVSKNRIRMMRADAVPRDSGRKVSEMLPFATANAGAQQNLARKAQHTESGEDVCKAGTEREERTEG